MPYQIERTEYTSDDKLVATCTIGILYKDSNDANAMIRTYAEAQRPKVRDVIHRVGQSVIVYDNYRVEFTRVSSKIENF